MSASKQRPVLTARTGAVRRCDAPVSCLSSMYVSAMTLRSTRDRDRKSPVCRAKFAAATKGTNPRKRQTINQSGRYEERTGGVKIGQFHAHDVAPAHPRASTPMPHRSTTSEHWQRYVLVENSIGQAKYVDKYPRASCSGHTSNISATDWCDPSRPFKCLTKFHGLIRRLP